MNLQTFFDNFELLAEAPNGVKKLRELILQLAVMGKLAPQDHNDEPASVLFDKIKAEKIRLISKNKIGKARTYNRIDKIEIPYKLPENWRWVRLTDVCYDLGQKKPDVEFTYIDVSAINKEKGIISDEFSILQPDEAPSRARKIVSKGTVIYSTVRPYLLNIAIVDKQFEPEPIVSTAFAVLHPFSGILAKYLYFYLRSKAFIEYVEVQMKGMAYPAINDTQLYQGLVPLPPLNEQHRIVAKVHQLMKLCDELEAQQQKKREARVTINNTAIAQLLTAREPQEFNKSWQRIYNNFDLLYSTPENIGNLRSCILQLAVMGKLAPQDPRDEPASVLLEKIQVEKTKLASKKKVTNFKKQVVTEINEIPFKIPNHWLWLKIDSLYDVCGGIQKTPKRNPISNFFPYLRVANVHRGRLDLSQLEYFELVEGELEKWRLETGDLLIVEGNGSESEIGRCAVWNREIDNCVHQNHIIRARPIGHNGQLFTLLFLNSPSGMAEMRKLAITTSGLYSLSVGKIREILVPLPPIAEQHRIIAKVKQLMTLCDQLEAQLKQSVAKNEKLMETAVRQLLDVNTVAADNMSVEPTKLENKTVKQRSKKTQSHGGETAQLNLQLF